MYLSITNNIFAYSKYLCHITWDNFKPMFIVIFLNLKIVFSEKEKENQTLPYQFIYNRHYNFRQNWVVINLGLIEIFVDEKVRRRWKWMIQMNWSHLRWTTFRNSHKKEGQFVKMCSNFVLTKISPTPTHTHTCFYPITRFVYIGANLYRYIHFYRVFFLPRENVF